jgi:hypothetical protein
MRYFVEIMDYKGNLITSQSDTNFCKKLASVINCNTTDELDDFTLKCVIPRLSEDNSINSYISIFEEKENTEYFSVIFNTPEKSNIREYSFTKEYLDILIKCGKVKFDDEIYIKLTVLKIYNIYHKIVKSTFQSLT